LNSFSLSFESNFNSIVVSFVSLFFEYFINLYGVN
jgi:hypothetical protein